MIKIFALPFIQKNIVSLLLCFIVLPLFIPVFTFAQNTEFSQVGNTELNFGSGITPTGGPVDFSFGDGTTESITAPNPAGGNTDLNLNTDDSLLTGGGSDDAVSGGEENDQITAAAANNNTRTAYSPNLTNNTFANFVYGTLTAIGGVVMWVGGNVLDYAIDKLVLDFGRILSQNFGLAVERIWTIVRDFFNIIFIFALIWMGLKTILYSDDSDVKRNLGMLILAALLINFSLFITKTVVDFSNIAALQIAESMKIHVDGGGSYNIPGPDFVRAGLSDASTHVSVAFADSMKIASFAGEIQSSEDGSVYWGRLIAFSFMSLIVMLIAGFVFLAGGILLIVRFVSLILAMMLSPAMFLGWIYPALKPFTSKWWNFFLRNAFVAPAYLFMLYIVLMLISVGEGGLGINNGTFANAFDKKSVENGNFGIFLYFGVIITMLIAATKVAGYMSASGASAVEKVGMYGANKLYGGAKLTANAAHRNSVGRYYDSSVKKLDEARARAADPNQNTRLRDRLRITAARVTGGGSVEEGRRYYENKTKTGILGGRGLQAIKDDKKTVATRAAADTAKANLSNVISTWESDKSADNVIAMSDAVSSAGASDLAKLLTKPGLDSKTYDQIISQATPDQIKKLNELKDDELNNDQKQKINAARSTAVKAKIQSKDGGGELTMDEAIKKASVKDLGSLDLNKDILANAFHLQAKQLDDMKKDSFFEGPRFDMIKKAHEDALSAPGITSEDIIKSRKGDGNIANLPSKIWQSKGEDIVEYLDSEDKLSNSLLTKIAKGDLDGDIKSQLGQYIITKFGGETALNTPGSGFPPRLQKFFTTGAGIDMR